MNKHYYNRYSHPVKNTAGRLLNFLLNNAVLNKINGLLFYWFTLAKLRSDITQVVYLNWLVPFQKIAHLIPEHAKIKLYDDQALFTVLSYQHGHFGPKSMRRFKRIFGSPLQSNWRLYLENNDAFGAAGPAVLFVKNIINDLTYTVGSRMFSTILQTHLPHSFVHHAGSNTVATTIIPGESNAPDLMVQTKITGDWKLPEPMANVFANPDDLLHIICEQNYAVSALPGKNKYSVAKINLDFDPSGLKPMELVDFRSDWLEPIVDGSPCFAFLMPKVTFTTLGEKVIKFDD